jgi:hypothetical protein
MEGAQQNEIELERGGIKKIQAFAVWNEEGMELATCPG